MKTLYVSDLDGTLFNSDKRLSDYSVQTINKCIDKGMLFTVATARMPYGCDYRLEQLKLSCPGILTNGVFLYDFNKQEIISAETIKQESVSQVIESFKKYHKSCFVYLYRDLGISIYYDDKKMERQKQYYSDRALLKCNEVRKVDDLKNILSKGEVAYIAYTGKQEELVPICNDIKSIVGINYSFYLNIYNGLYCLEIYSNHASKKNAIQKVKELTKSKEIVVFGDNLNDIPMIEIADRSYAPNNALPEICDMVNAIIDDHDKDGVAKFLAKEWEID